MFVAFIMAGVHLMLYSTTSDGHPMPASQSGQSRKRHNRRVSRGKWKEADDKLVTISPDRMRVAIKAAGGCTAVGRGIGEKQQTLDLIARGRRRHTRLSRVKKIARYCAPAANQSDEVVDWFMGRRDLIPPGSASPETEWANYRLTHEIAKVFHASMRLSPRDARSRKTFERILLSIARPDLWRAWLLPQSARLTGEEEERTAEHLAEAFRILLKPLYTGEGRINIRAIRALKELGILNEQYIDD
jgi:hypothetical protein